MNTSQWKSVEGFFDGPEIQFLLNLRDSYDEGDWAPGRQAYQCDSAEKYLKVLVAQDRNLYNDDPLDELIFKCMTKIAKPPTNWDCYLIDFPDKSRILPHIDPLDKDGLNHVRMNVIIERGKGGHFIIDGKCPKSRLGDGMIFYPDRQRHELTEVLGRRTVFSVGIAYDKSFG